ncbi:putative minor capsid protein [Caulobacter phage CcrRogue]|uniref:Putative minor capsid protein n=1 Tax=Caulobacter phage CcrRogue TaxID=2927986 RepID=K4JS41_9CAUD|nr:putative minor capsid protein [Caulobacter phage CcrRogue]AFU86553.1 putative minor capsid protein [Caulobacter phage CcrRogue]
MESKIRHQYDALLALQPVGTAAVTADGSSVNSVDLYRIANGRGDIAGRYGIGSFDIVFNFKAITTGGTVAETYSVSVVTTDAAGANPVVQHTFTVDAGLIGDPYVLAFHPASLKLKDADAAKVKLTIDVAGTAPSLDFFAFVAPHSHQ